VLDSKAEFSNGDGLCFFSNETLLGTRINFIKGNKLFLNSVSGIELDTVIYRNHDVAFENFLARNKLKRKIEVDFIFSIEKNILLLKAIDIDKNEFSVSHKIGTAEFTNNNIDLKNKLVEQLRKTGATVFKVRSINILNPINTPVAHSIINQLRRDVLSGLESMRLKNYDRVENKIIPNSTPYPEENLDYTCNVVNQKAKDFYRRHSVKNIDDGFELSDNQIEKMIMKTKYCVKFEIGECPIENKHASNQPLFVINNCTKYRLEFNCKECNTTLWTV